VIGATLDSNVGLHGRAAELARIGELIGAARDQRAGVLVLRGQAGIGKSALLESARDLAPDMQVLACAGIESETRLPFAALHQLLRPVLGHLDALPGVQARALRCALGLESLARPEPFLVSLAVLSLLVEASEHAPLLLLVDDAHWLDEATADVLVFVARRLDAEAIAVLLAVREDEDARLELRGLAQLPVAGLDADAARAILDERAGAALSQDVATWLIDATDGNPLALLELSARLSEGQRAASRRSWGRCRSARTWSARSSSAFTACRRRASGCCS
jgi:predicted ATPase